ncbi:MAG: metal ABC transporter substrate-binding protein [Vulcanimicrobiota bacterium]
MRINQINIVLVMLVILSLCAPQECWAGKPLVVTTTTDLADFVKNIGGDRLEVYSIARGTEDPHFIEPKPSHITRLIKAKLYFVLGMEMEIGYSPVLERGANRPDVSYGGSNYIDCSKAIRPIDIPERADRAKGDIHPQGNPHYLTDPQNALLVVNYIADTLKSHFPQDAEFFEKNRAVYVGKLKEKMKEWEKALAPFKGTKIVTYHKLWSYFFRRYHFDLLGTVEPVPGIAPSPAHVSKLINLMKAQGCKYIMMANYFEKKSPETIAKATGAKLIVVPAMTRSTKEAPDYIALMDFIVGSLAQAMK